MERHKYPQEHVIRLSFKGVIGISSQVDWQNCLGKSQAKSELELRSVSRLGSDVLDDLGYPDGHVEYEKQPF